MGLFDKLPQEVSIYEVSPRDGLQNEPVTVSTSNKVRLIEALLDSGLSRVEVSSFVSPQWVPQLADAVQVIQSLPKRAGLRTRRFVQTAKALNEPSKAASKKSPFSSAQAKRTTNAT